jgi:predicted dehydrogenase
MDAGKHVYGEKPMARYLHEGFAMYDTAKRTSKIFQMGSQFCADPMFHQAAEWVRAGKLGPLVWGQGAYCRNGYPRSEWTYPVEPDANESNLDWKRWLGKTPPIPFDPNRFFSWHKFYAYNSGILGNLLPHKLLPMMLATGNPEYPRRVIGNGTRKVSTDREITDTTQCIAEFPSGLSLTMIGSTVNDYGVEDVLRGQRASLFFASGRNAVSLKPQRAFAKELTAEEFSSPLGVADLARLEKNFFDCIRSGGVPWGNIELAIRAHVVICLAEMSERMNLALLFDSESRKVTTGHNQPVAPLDYDTVLPEA